MLKIIEEEDFIEKCRSGKCLRQTIKSKQCEKDSKKIQCYKKYVTKKEKEYAKDNIDYEWEDLKRDITIRDMSCLVTKILTIQELKQLEKEEGFWLNHHTDGAHIVSRSQSLKNVYNRDNVVLIGRFFHSRLDQGLDLITGEFIGFEGSKEWWNRIMHENGLWKKDYTYDDFYKEITGEK